MLHQPQGTMLLWKNCQDLYMWVWFHHLQLIKVQLSRFCTILNFLSLFTTTRSWIQTKFNDHEMVIPLLVSVNGSNQMRTLPTLLGVDYLIILLQNTTRYGGMLWSLILTIHHNALQSLTTSLEDDHINLLFNNEVILHQMKIRILKPCLGDHGSCVID